MSVLNLLGFSLKIFYEKCWRCHEIWNISIVTAQPIRNLIMRLCKNVGLRGKINERITKIRYTIQECGYLVDTIRELRPIFGTIVDLNHKTREIILKVIRYHFQKRYRYVIKDLCKHCLVQKTASYINLFSVSQDIFLLFWKICNCFFSSLVIFHFPDDRLQTLKTRIVDIHTILFIP